MILCPSLSPLHLLLLLLSGALCRAEAGSETESPIRTLQVETLVRRLSWFPASTAGTSQEYWDRRNLGGRRRGTAGTELGGAGSREQQWIFGGASVTLVVRSQVEPPEPCAETAAFGDTLHIHYTVRAGRGGAGRSLEEAVPR